jgi:hypothetical protein
MGAFVISNVLAIAGPWLGFLRGLFIVAGVCGTVAAALIGFGAVLITRAGSRFDFYSVAEPYGASWDDDLSPSADPVDPEPQDQGGP